MAPAIIATKVVVGPETVDVESAQIPGNRISRDIEKE